MQPQSNLMPLPQCPICKAKSRKHLYAIKDTHVYECHQCKLRYLDPCLNPEAMKGAYESNESLSSLHDFHEGYYDYGDLRASSKTLRDFKRGLDLIEIDWPRFGKILDVGYGNGLFLAAAKARGWEVRGVDSSKANQEIARKKFGLELTCLGFEDYKTTDFFQAITFWDVLEHIPNPHDVINQMNQFLVPGGLLLFAVPNDGSFLVLLAEMLYRLGLKKIVNKVYFLEHVNYYSLESLSKLMSAHQFRYKAHFYTSTDLAKYSLSMPEKFAATCVLTAGRLLKLQNRLVVIYKKPD